MLNALRTKKKKIILSDLSSKGLTTSRTFYREISGMENRIAAKVLESEQKIEDYLMKLNRNGQYGVILYSNGELVPY